MSKGNIISESIKPAPSHLLFFLILSYYLLTGSFHISSIAKFALLDNLKFYHLIGYYL
jgi:hypothetical protein